MLKVRAIHLLGGTVTSCAEAVGVTSSAVTQWPDWLPGRIADRVLAALARKYLPVDLVDWLTSPELGSNDAPPLPELEAKVA
jgi:hypothetical protein